MFSDSFQHILSDNMSAILELNNSRESRILRLLFFSITADVQDDHLNIKILKIKLRYRDKFYIHMKIMINLNIYEQSFIFRIWRNEFLSHLIIIIIICMLFHLNDIEFCKLVYIEKKSLKWSNLLLLRFSYVLLFHLL